MKKLYIPYNQKLIEVARENRKNPTHAEKKIWFRVLKSRQFENYKFIRQKPLDNFIVDFYCSELMLAIEIDGDSHVIRQEYDVLRSEKLKAYGIKVVRYTNNDVMFNIEEVYQDLKEKIKKIKPYRQKHDVLQN
ncbi:endonuclease domain-containing protein [Patescibacteria group bacterium]|nr:endonuclease domain-containing protein [Patescibacteria group bacterium]MBU4353239.1 endonuclease domain-containing protein [Patescibacteria group bacterium]MBU4477135.1 endonuclease domain-containing protein [Patescibacteria group bacterium]MCG2698936.1 endonuclease domain-containing protein [Candidatus Parcubacteria bacterium]